MISGADTTFLVEAEVVGHPHHEWARATLSELVDRGDRIALASQVLAEFVHVVSDPKRFGRPLPVERALDRAGAWWNAGEVEQVAPNGESGQIFLDWMRAHRLGRRRLLDTMLASTYYAHGITTILSSNTRDYAVFGCFNLTGPDG